MAKIFLNSLFVSLQYDLNLFKSYLKLHLGVRIVLSVGIAIMTLYGFLLLPLVWSSNPFGDEMLSGVFLFMAGMFSFIAWNSYEKKAFTTR